MKLRDLVYGAYERRLARQLDPDRVPRHVGVILDGNRRWAKAAGAPTSRRSPRRRRQDRRPARLVRGGRGRARHAVAALHGQPRPPGRRADAPDDDHREHGAVGSPTPVGGASTRWARWICSRRRQRASLKEVGTDTAGVDGMTVNIAVGYGGRREIADAVRSLLHDHAERGTSIEELAEVLDVEHIAEHLYTRASPIPTWSSVPRASSGSVASCCGSRRTPSSTSARPTGLTSVASTSCAPCAPTPSDIAATAPETTSRLDRFGRHTMPRRSSSTRPFDPRSPMPPSSRPLRPTLLVRPDDVDQAVVHLDDASVVLGHRIWTGARPRGPPEPGWFHGGVVARVSVLLPSRCARRHATWREQLRLSEVLVQWDPERSWTLQPLPYRTIQVGLGRRVVMRYVDKWIDDIVDVTDRAHAARDMVTQEKSRRCALSCPSRTEVVLPTQSARLGWRDI